MMPRLKLARTRSSELLGQLEVPGAEQNPVWALAGVPRPQSQSRPGRGIGWMSVIDGDESSPVSQT
jgi:hypothetical protein